MHFEFCGFYILNNYMDKIEEGVFLNQKNIVGQTFEFQLDDHFFQNSNGLITKGNVHVIAKCHKMTQGQYLFHVNTAGYIFTPCDRCLAEVELRIDNDNEFTAQIGDEDYDNGDVVTVNAKRPFIDIKNIAYQFVVIALPVRRVHQPGVCDQVMMKAIENHSVTRNERADDNDDSNPLNEEEDNKTIDPRWNVLKNLLNK